MIRTRVGQISRVSLVAALVILFASGACRRGEKAGTGGEIDDATLTYGYGPDLNGTARYQPDVVIVRGGPRAIRSASADGLVWTIDGKAPGANELREGKIMFVTSRAVGRIVKIEPVGSDLAVTLGPVSLTEVVQEANISFKRALNPDAMVYQEIPDLPGKISVPPPLANLQPEAPVSHASYGNAALRPFVWWLPNLSVTSVGHTATALAGGGNLPPPSKNSLKVSVGDWEVEPYMKTQEKKLVAKSQKFGLKVQRKFGSQKGKIGGTESSTGLKVGVDAGFYARNLRFDAAIPITAGTIDPTAHFIIDGIDELVVDIAAGVEKGITDNERIRVEIPVEITEQIPPSPATGGIPMIAQIKFKFIVSTAFSANNSTINATGRYGLKGPMGYAKGSMVAPAFEVMQPLIPSIGGVSLGASGIVFAFEVRSLLGVGVPAAVAGPYVKIITSLGLSRGSDLGLVKCRGATLKLDVGGGIGTQVSTVVLDVLERLLGKKSKIEMELAEVLTTMVNRSAVSPDVPLCGGGGAAGGPAA